MATKKELKTPVKRTRMAFSEPSAMKNPHPCLGNSELDRYYYGEARTCLKPSVVVRYCSICGFDVFRIGLCVDHGGDARAVMLMSGHLLDNHRT